MAVYYTSVDRNALTPLLRFVVDLLHVQLVSTAVQRFRLTSGVAVAEFLS